MSVRQCGMKLHKINHDLKTVLWCGPGALCTLTGLPSSRIMAVLKYVTGKPVVKGVSVGHLAKAAAFLGYQFVPQSVYSLATENGLPTLAKWTSENSQLLSKGAVVFVVSNHFVTVSGRKFCDNWTRVPVALKKAPRRRARVHSAWHVVPIVGFKPQPLPTPPPDLKSARPNYSAKAYALARKHEIEVTAGEPSPDCIWVGPPPSLTDEDTDRYAGDHYVYDWAEALERVRGYVEDLGKVPVTPAVSEAN